ncbi:MAG: adenosylcobalamin-dependent ribonucleoside-diphosphate reductase, partial [Alicyclobacillus sp.]|nr:adenosylcobalamin-dependent ribonucleoside-diphosphate reductase [Alicyclobacillus sp.]
LMASLDFLPNSPTLMNAGADLQQLSACFVLPIEDSLESIFGTLRDAALIHQSGGGTGFNFSRLRPKGDPVQSTGGVASGPVSFMRIFNAATEEIKQGGVRRGANMGILKVDHPDILEFIACKEQEGAFRNFNISVAVNDEFFEAMERDGDFPLVFGGRVYKTLPAKQVFGEITRHAHKNGEPGLLFLDAVNRANPTPALGAIEATNPCGEQPLLPYESCTLGSINLVQMTEGKEVAWTKLRRVVHDAVRFLDNVIEVNSFPTAEIAAATRRTRKIGLGIMGWADMLYQLGIPYDSAAALKLAEKVASFIREEARTASRALARERGVFPAWEKSVYYPELPLRNATLTTIAPTGSVSAIAGVSPGIEPVFALSYSRSVLDGKKLLVVDKVFSGYLRANFPEPQREAILNTVYLNGTLREAEGVPPETRKVFKTALEIKPEWHLKMQAAFQKYVDNAVSKTVNLPQTATETDVAAILRQAHTFGLKGLTLYRSGSRKDQPLIPLTSCPPCQEN